jgi:hypothetical protein
VEHGERARIQLRGDRELSKSTIPVPEDHEELRQENAQLSVRGLLAHLGLQLCEATREISGSK